jgi:uncharacterized HAD superfamily protein/hypoxanthine phosphoribosyltransferase
VEFRTYQDLNNTILRNISKIPQNVDLIVGIPRSGLMVASIIALYRNLPLTSLDDFLDGNLFTPGITKPKNGWIKNVHEARKILIVEDSVNSGASIQKAKNLIKEKSDCADKCIYLAAYVKKSTIKLVDLYFEVLELPRIFQWNFLQHVYLSQCCFDIDGVLCDDPSPDQNDDGPNYRDFLLHAPLKLYPQRQVKYLVSSRLEKYRPETENWLKENHISYGELILMNLPSAEERRRLGNHAEFKAEQYRKHSDAVLFIESDDIQAQKIFQLTNKPVFCINSQQYYCDKKRERKIALRFQQKEKYKAFLKRFLLVRIAIKIRNKLRKID